MSLRIGILTVSDRVARGEMDDRGGPAIEAPLVARGWTISARKVVADEQEEIAAVLRHWTHDMSLDAIFTTGGTGLSPRDVTPEATVADGGRLIPGIPELLRARGLQSTPGAALSRGVALVRGTTLIVNLPGSPSGAGEGAMVVAEILEHAVATLHGASH